MKTVRRTWMCLFWLMLFLAFAVTCGNGFAGVSVRPASQISNDTTEWMKKVADWQLTQSSWDSSVDWLHGALFAGMMACYETTKDETYLDECRRVAGKFNWRLASTSHHADNNAVGQLYTELYLLDTQDPARYAHFKNVSDSHVAGWPTFNCDVSGGNETWWWCDALFMAPPGLVRLSRATGNPVYANFMHKMWTDTQTCLYDTTEHLFFRDITYFYPGKKNCNGDKVFWSRGNGWVVGGTARVLQYLSPDDPNRPRYTTLLQEMSSALKDVQQSDGYWYADLFGPNCVNNPETSGTGFFTFGIAWAMNNGLLNETAYWPTVEAGWEALKAAVLPDGKLGWVQPVGVGPASTTATTTAVYGVGAYLLAGSEVIKYQQRHDPNAIEYFESYTGDAALQAAWADGDTNGSSAQVTLGDYADNFMLLSYANDQSPYRSQTDYTFTPVRNFLLNDANYLSVVVRGNESNAPGSIYVVLEDTAGHTATQIMDWKHVVRMAGWMELGFPFAEFTGLDLTQIRRLSIGVGLPNVSSASGQGILRIDNISLRTYSESSCFTVQEDFNSDCKIDMQDFAVLAAQWLEDYSVTVNPVDPGTANLVAHWPFDGNYNDVTGHGYDASAGLAVSFDAGHIGQSVYFDATDNQSYLNCANSSGMHLSSGATVSAWVKSSSLIDQYASVVTKGVQAWRLIRNNTSDAISFHFNNAVSGEYQANGSTDIVDNQWHHLMGVYDGGMVYLYVDGQLDAAANAGPIKTTTDPVYIGSRINNTTNRNWLGWIDDVRIYNIALTYENLLYLSESDPVHYIPSPSRPTDLVLDGTINFDDLMIFIESWTQNTYWP